MDSIELLKEEFAKFIQRLIVSRCLFQRLAFSLHLLKMNDMKLNFQVITDSLFFFSFVLSILAVRMNSYLIGALAGLVISWTITAAHNYFHKKDNFRMYYFNLTFLSYREWRVTHGMSHHLYTNSIYDIEISMFEPFQHWLPMPKSKIRIFVHWIISPLFYMLFFHLNLLVR
jgi:hypothetical protein